MGGETFQRILAISLLCASCVTGQRVEIRTDQELGGRRPTRDVLVEDFDGDGRCEIVFGYDRGRDGSDGGVRILSMRNGRFEDRTPVSLTVFRGSIRDLAVGDIDGDGRLDLAAITEHGLRAWIQTGYGNALSFGFATPGPEVYSARKLTLYKLPGATRAAWFVANHATVFRFDSLHAHSTPLIGLPSPVNALVTADMNGNGTRELIVAATDRVLRVPIQSKTHEGMTGVQRLPAHGAEAVTVTDIDADGFDDVALCRLYGNRVVHGSAKGIGNMRWMSGGTEPTRGVAASDIDGDGLMDLIGVSERGARGWLARGPYFWLGNDYFVPNTQVPASSVATGDLDGDGDDDVVLVSDDGHDRVWLANTIGLELVGAPAPGRTLGLEVFGRRGYQTPAVVYVSPALSQAPTKTELGALALDSSQMVEAARLTIPTWGQRRVRFPVPVAQKDARLYAQVLVMDPVTGPRLGGVVTLDVRGLARDANANGWIEPRIHVDNSAGPDRYQLVTASVPFPEGERATVDDLWVGRQPTDWRVLQRWPDGTVRVAQAQWHTFIQAGAVWNYGIVSGRAPVDGAFDRNDSVAQSNPGRLVMKAVDGLGFEYRAEIGLDGGEVLSETVFERVTRHRVYHQPVRNNGLNRDFLSSTIYLTERRIENSITVDWIVGNDYLGADDRDGKHDPNLSPLGHMDVREVVIGFEGFDTVRALDPERHDVSETGAAHAFSVLRDTFLGDGQTRRYRFEALIQPKWTAERWAIQRRERLDARIDHPLLATATLDTWQRSRAFGVLGDLCDAPSDLFSRVDDELGTWRRRADESSEGLGTWGTFGDVIYTGTSGTPRNAPISPEGAHLLQSMDPRLMQPLREKAWAQAHRPYHLFGLKVGERESIYLYDPIPARPGLRDLSPESLGRRALLSRQDMAPYKAGTDRRNHGFNGYDVNHWTTDLLFDYWTLTGDHWAQEEIRQLGESLMAMMRLERFQLKNISNARAEGWTMAGFVQAYLATGDERLKDFAFARIDEIIEPQRWKGSVPVIREQRPDPRSGFGADVTFYPPWEHGSVMVGFLAAHHFFGSQKALAIAEDVTKVIDYAWVRDYTEPDTGTFIPHAVRYWCPLRQNGEWLPASVFDYTQGAYIPSHPLGSVNQMLVAGLFHLERFSKDADVLALARFQRRHLLPAMTDTNRWNKWFVAVPESLVD
ncbi:MAG: VCBS repeat-containing protein [Planctomycetota bacterium]